MWLVGKSYTFWSLRLDLINYGKEEKEEDDYENEDEEEVEEKPKQFCPTGPPPEGAVWEYLHSRNGEDEIWLKDAIFEAKCVF